MAEQENVNITNRELKELEIRQKGVLNKINELTSRLNQIQRQSGTEYDTSKLTKESFQTMEAKQSAIFQRLLKIACDVDKIATKQNIPLPRTNEVCNVVQNMAKSLQERQRKSLNKLNELTEKANSLHIIVSSEIKDLIGDRMATKAKEDKKEEEEEDDNKDDEKENKYIQRQNELKLVGECLKQQCIRIDNNESGKITQEQILSLLDKVSLYEIDGAVNDTKHIKTIIDELCDDSMIDYNNFFDLVSNIDETDKLSNNLSSSWNSFRNNLIGKSRIDGKLRILYRYDGWPEPQIILIKSFDSKNKSKLPLKQVMELIQKNIKDKLEYAQLRYAQNPTYVPGKRGWKPLDHDNIAETVPFLNCNDGILEIDVWLRTQSFIDNKGGKPVPEDDDNLVEVD